MIVCNGLLDLFLLHKFEAQVLGILELNWGYWITTIILNIILNNS